MSVSSNIRKESTESHAAQQMRSTQGLHPESGLAQLNDKQLDNELTSRRADTGNDTDFTDELADTQATAATEGDGPSQAEIDENTRASWGQAPTEGATRPVQVDDADWNTSTEKK